MSSFFYNMGRKSGKAMRKPKWYYKSFFGSAREALQAENIFGRELAEQMKRELVVIEDAGINRFINRVGDILTQRVMKAERKFTFIPVKSTDINAFALPGGNIFLTSAILELCANNDDALAFILSHEMVHVVSRHPLNRIMANKSLAVLANMLKAGGIAGQLAKKTLGALIESTYSQENEFHADRYGLQLMIRCGFSGKTGIETLKNLQNSAGGNEAFNYFSTHPSIPERVNRLQRELRSMIE